MVGSRTQPLRFRTEHIGTCARKGTHVAGKSTTHLGLDVVR